MTEQEKFLETFRKYETVVRTLGYESAKDYEDSVKDVAVQDKLRICRTMRNFLAHGKDSAVFVSVSANMQKFMDDTVYQLDEGASAVKKKMIPIAKCIHESNTVEDAISSMVKLKVSAIPVFSKTDELAGVISYESFAKGFLESKITKTTKLSSVDLYIKTKGKEKPYVLVDEEDTVRNVFSYYQAGKAIVITNHEKPIGLFVKK